MLFPHNFGNPQWEFGIITSVFGALPVTTMGLSLVAMSAVINGRRWLGTLSSVLLLLTAVILMLLMIVYLLDVPVALKSNPPEVRPVLYRAMLKTGASALVYTSYYLWAAVFTWKHRPPNPSRS